MVFGIHTLKQVFHKDFFVTLAYVPRIVGIFIRDASLYLLRLEESCFGLTAPSRFFVKLFIVLSEEWSIILKDLVWC